MPLTSAQKQARRREKLDAVAADLGYDSHYQMMTAIINGEIEMKRNIKLVAGPGQSVFDALDEAKRDGDVPQTARIGGPASDTQGWRPRPENAIGTVKMDARRRRWIVSDDS